MGEKGIVRERERERESERGSRMIEKKVRTDVLCNHAIPMLTILSYRPALSGHPPTLSISSAPSAVLGPFLSHHPTPRLQFSLNCLVSCFLCHLLLHQHLFTNSSLSDSLPLSAHRSPSTPFSVISASSLFAPSQFSLSRHHLYQNKASKCAGCVYAGCGHR